MLEEHKLKEKGKNTSIFLHRHQIVTLLARANQIDDELSEEHQTFFNKSIEEVIFRVGESLLGSGKQNNIFLTTYNLKFSIDRRLLVRLPPLVICDQC